MHKGHSHNIDYYSYVSNMRQWNSGFKVVFSLISLIMVLVMDSWLVAIWTMLFMGFLTVAIGKINIIGYLKTMSIPLMFIIMSGIAIIFDIQSVSSQWEEVPNLICRLKFLGYYLFITKDKIDLAMRLGFKALGGISAMYLLTLSTPMGEIIAVLKKAYVPDMLIEIMYLTYRYIFILMEIYHRQKDAAISRLGYKNYTASIRSFSYSLANLLILSLKKSNECFDAMESRGYNGTLNMSEESHPVTVVQVVCMALYIVGACILFIGYRRLCWGTI